MNTIKVFSVCFLIIIIQSVLSNDSDIEKYTPMGLELGSFSEYDKQNLGESGHFIAQIICPNSAKEITERIQGTVNIHLDALSSPLEIFFPKVKTIKEDLKKAINIQIESEVFNNFAQSIWGMCVANSENNPDGEDNLFVFVDNEMNNLCYLDFGHPVDWASYVNMDDSDPWEKLSNIFKIDYSWVILPDAGRFTFSYKEITRGLSNFKDPRGICTDRVGGFWVADKGNNRIIRLFYNIEKRQLVYIGELVGLNSPNDVTIVFPDASGQSKKLLGIANTGGNSVIFVRADFEGTKNYSDYSDNERCEISEIYHTNGDHIIENPQSIAANRINIDDVYVAISTNKILKLKRRGDFSFSIDRDNASTRWPRYGLITCIQNDNDGNLFVVDNTNSFIGKYTKDLELIFTTGGFSTENISNMACVKFNQPKYLAIGSEVDNFFVSEKMEGYTGVKRFTYLPRFLEDREQFHLSCIDNSYMEFEWELTKDGYVKVVLFQKANVSGGWNQVFVRDVNNGGLFNAFAGYTITDPILFEDMNGNPLPDEGEFALYKCEFTAYRDVNGQGESDFVVDIVDLNAPDFLHQPVEMHQVYFSPYKVDPTWPYIKFQVTRDAKIIFRLLPEGGGDEIPITTDKEIFKRKDTDDLHEVMLYVSDPGSMTQLAPYELWAEMHGIPCGQIVDKVVPTSARIILDTEEPDPITIEFDMTNPEIPSGIENINVFNPDNQNFNTIHIASKEPLHDNSNESLLYSTRIYRTNDPTKTLVSAEDINANGQDEHINTNWNGLKENGSSFEEGEYGFEAKVYDPAKNVRYGNGEFYIDKTKPTVLLALKDIGKEYDYTDVNGKECLIVQRDKPVTVLFSITDDVALPHKFQVELAQGQAGIYTYDFFDVTPVFDLIEQLWEGSFELNPSNINKFPKDGVYSVKAYAIDRAGNKSEFAFISDNGHPSVDYILINYDVPNVTISAMPPSMNPGEVNNLFIDATPQTSSELVNFNYTYTVHVYLDYQEGQTNIPVHTFPEGNLNASNHKARLEFKHNQAGFPGDLGRFTYEVIVNDGVGSSGNNHVQYADFFVGVFETQIDGPDFAEVPRKFYITGQVGDPDLTNGKDFERYEIGIINNGVTQLPADLDGWDVAPAYVPFHKVDRNQEGLPEDQYPLTNLADNQEAITQSWGRSVLGYFDASSGSLDPGIYTVIVVTKEKGTDDLVINDATADMRIVTITDNLQHPQFDGDISFDGDITITGSDVQFVAGDDKKMKIIGEVSHVPDKLVNITAYIYRTTKVVDSEGNTEGIIARIRKFNVHAGETFEFVWDGKNDNKSYVRDGDYRIALVLEEAGVAKNDYAYDHKIVSDYIIKVTTPLQIVEGTMGPPTIFLAPTNPGDNITTFNYKVSKPCDVYLEISPPAGAAFLNGPETSIGGSENRFNISWDGTKPNGEAVALGVYTVQPFAVPEGIDPEAQPGQKVPYTSSYNITVAYESQDNPNMGNFDLLPQTYGNTDAYWETQVFGKLWDFPALTTSFDFWVEGKQTVKSYTPAEFQGEYIKKHNRIKFLVKVRWKIKRKLVEGNEGALVSCCNKPNSNDWVYWTYSVLKDVDNSPGTPHPHPEYESFNCEANMDAYVWDGIDGPEDACLYGCKFDEAPGPPTKCAPGWDEHCYGECKWTPVGFYCISIILKLNKKIIDVDPVIEWIGIYNESGTELIDVLDNSGGNPPGGDDPGYSPSLVFSKRGEPETDRNVNNTVGLVQGEVNIDWNKLKIEDQDFFTNGTNSESLYPGDPVLISINTSAFENGIPFLVEGYDTKPTLEIVNSSLPPGGTITFNEPTSWTITNPNDAATPISFDHTFSGTDFDGADKVHLIFEHEIELDQDAQTTTVDIETVFPFPEPDGNGDCWWHGINLCDDEHWVLKNNKPDAMYPNDCVRYLTSTNDITRNAGPVYQFGHIPDASEITLTPDDGASPYFPQYEYFKFKYDGIICTDVNGCDDVNTHDDRVRWYIQYLQFQSLLSANYPFDEDGAEEIDWNIASMPDYDPVLAKYNSKLKGYLHVSKNELYNLYNNDHFNKPLNVADCFRDVFVPAGSEISIPDAYAVMADNADEYNGIPVYTPNWETYDKDEWKYAFWRDDQNSDKMVFHQNKGIHYESWAPLTFTYVDGITPNECFKLKDPLNFTTGEFRPEIKPNSVSKRFIPIDFNFQNMNPGDTWEIIDVSVFNPQNNAWDISIGDFVSNPVTVTENGKVNLGFWKSTYEAGTYFVRLLAKDQSQIISQRRKSVMVGSEVPDQKPVGGMFIKSPLKRAMIWFPENSKYVGMVSLNPLPEEMLPYVPDGFVVDVTPSGLVFEDELPELVFYLTPYDIVDFYNDPGMDIYDIKLGDLGVYYLDEDNQFKKENFSGYKYDIDGDGNLTNPVEVDNQTVFDNDNQILKLGGGIRHTSLYGALSRATFIYIDEPQSPTSLDKIPKLTGSSIGNMLITEDVYLYVSNTESWNTSIPRIPNVVHENFSDGTWYVYDVDLPYAGENYIFANLGEPTAAVPPNSRVVVIRDNTVPEITSLSINPQNAIQGIDAVLVTVTLNEPGNVFLTIPQITDIVLSEVTSGNNNSSTFSIPLYDKSGKALEDGEYSVFATANDLVGNLAEGTEEGIIRVAKTPPEIREVKTHITYNSGTDEYTVLVTGKVLDNSGMGIVSACIIEGDPAWQSDMNMSGVQAGVFVIQFNTPNWQNYFEEGDIVTLFIFAEDLLGNSTDYTTKIKMIESDNLSDWQYSKDIIINTTQSGAAVNEDFKDCPIRVKLHGSNFTFDQAEEDGKDIRFAINNYVLPYEIEYWNRTDKDAEIWVKVPIIFGNNDIQTIQMFWGNPAAEEPNYGKLIWDGDYAAVYHMNTKKDGNNSGLSPLAPFALFALQGVELMPKARINDASVGSNGSAALLGIGVDQSAYIGVDVITGGDAVVEQSVVIGRDIKAQGSIDLDPTATVGRDVLPGFNVPILSIPTKSVSAGGPDLYLDHGSQTLTPGDYGDITLHSLANLYLQTGIYNFKSFKVTGDDSHIYFTVSSDDDLIFINVENELNFEGPNSTGGLKLKMHLSGTTCPAAVRFYTNQASDVKFTNSSEFYGIFILPNAHANVDMLSEVNGAIFAKSIYVNWDAIINGIADQSWATETFIVDATIHENDGINYDAQGDDGIIGYGRTFDGDKDYIEFVHKSSLETPDAFTFTGWIKRDREDIEEAFAEKYDGSVGWKIGFDGMNKPVFTSGLGSLQSGSDILSGEWNHFGMIHDDEKMIIYVNGEESAVVEGADLWGGAPSSALMYFGKWDTDSWFNGSIDEFRISNRQRTKDWIKFAYENQKPCQKVVMIPPLAPENIVLTQTLNTNVQIEWSVPDPCLEYLEVERKLATEIDWTAIDAASASAGVFNDNTVECENDYLYRFRYRDGVAVSEYTVEYPISLLACEDEWPNDFKADLIYSEEVDLVWNDNATGETGYEVQKRLNGVGDPFAQYTITPADVTNVKVENLTCETSYDYRMRLLKGTHFSEWLMLEDLMTDYCDHTPEAPSGLSATVEENNVVSLTWSDNSSDEEYFIVYRRINSSQYFKIIDLVTEDITEFDDVTAPCGVTLEYAVAAFNSVPGGGLSEVSNSVQVTTNQCIQDDSRKMVRIACLILDNLDQPVNDNEADITIRLYTVPTGGTEVYTEAFSAEVKHGYVYMLLGTTGDMVSVLQNYNNLFYEVSYGGIPVMPRFMLNASADVVHNNFMLRGDGSPVGKVDAVTGSLYLNTVNKKLYFKYGPSVSDWKAVE